VRGVYRRAQHKQENHATERERVEHFLPLRGWGRRWQSPAAPRQQDPKPDESNGYNRERLDSLRKQHRGGQGGTTMMQPTQPLEAAMAMQRPQAAQGFFETFDHRTITSLFVGKAGPALQTSPVPYASRKKGGRLAGRLSVGLLC
jgi:hypothetical protein